MVVAEQPSAEQKGVECTAILDLCSDNKQNLHRTSMEQPSHNFYLSRFVSKLSKL